MAGTTFTFICGDDDYLVGERARALFEETSASLDDDMAKEVIDGRAGNVAEVEEAVQRLKDAVETLSLFGGRKVVWLRNVTFLADTQTGRAQGTLDELERLKTLLGRVDPEAVTVIVSAQPVDKRRSFYKWCQKNARFENLSAGQGKEDVLFGLIDGECEKAGARITRDARLLLVEKTGANTRMVVEETRKLGTFVADSGEEITEEVVTDLVPNFGGADFFEATEAFFSLRLEWTLDAIRRHFFSEENARPLLGSLQARNRLLIQLRALIQADALPSRGGRVTKAQLDAAAGTYGAHFPGSAEKSNVNVFTQNPWYLGRLAETAQKVPLKKLVDFQLAFTHAFEAIIQRPNEHEEVCRELAIRCLA